MPEIVVAAQSRTETGKNVNRRLRTSGLIPGVVYGAYRYAVTIKGVTRTGLSERMFLEDDDGHVGSGFFHTVTEPLPSLPELEARVRALIRRGQSGGASLLSHGALRLDTAAREMGRHLAEEDCAFRYDRGQKAGARSQCLEDARPLLCQLRLGLGQQHAPERSQHLHHGAGRRVMAVLVELPGEEPAAAGGADAEIVHLVETAAAPADKKRRSRDSW